MKRHLENQGGWGWNVYKIAIMLGGAAAAVFLSARFSEQVNQEQDVLLFLGILLLYVLFDLFRIPYREQTISLGFPVVLFALLGSQKNGPLIVAEIVVLGSLCSDSLYRLFARHNLLARFDRVLFYTAHHALAALDAMVLFDLARRRQILTQPLDTQALDSFADPSYLLAVVVYMVAYALVSSLLILPHDLAIRSLRLPEDEERLPRVHPVGSVVLMAPVPIALSVFVFALTEMSPLVRLALSLAFPSLFLAFLIIARSYAGIERETLSHRSREEVRRRLLGLTRFDQVLVDAVSDLVPQLLRRPDRFWMAIYCGPDGDGTLRLRGERAPAGQVRIHPAAVTAGPGDGSRPGAAAGRRVVSTEVRWPRQVKPGQGVLGRAVESRLAQSGLMTEVAPQASEADPLLPPNTAYLHIPLQHPGGVAGLLALARPRRPFTKTDLDRLMPLADVLGRSVVNIQRFERQIEELYGRVEHFVEDPMAVRRALEKLVARGLSIARMNEILARIPERAFHKHFDETLEAFAEGRAGNRLSTLGDEDLKAVYNEVRGQGVSGMPPLDGSILKELRTVASSLSVAFSFHHQLTERDLSEAYTPLYRACRNALKAESVSDITGQQSGVRGALKELEATVGIHPRVISALGRLGVAIADLEQVEQADRIDQRREGLKDALAELDAVEQTAKVLEPALRLIFFNWVTGWKRTVSAALAAVGAEEAELDLALRSKRALPREHVDVVLQVKNVGRGVATRVTAELLPQAGYDVVGERRSDLGALQTDKTKEAEFVIEPQEMDRLRLVFQVSYWDSQDTRPRTLPFADQFLLRGELPTYRRVDSPYVAGRPLPAGSPLFRGRDDVFEFIRQNVTLGGRREPQVLVLVGERRVGKTSIAKQLPLRLRDEGYIHVYFDAQGAVDRGQFLLTLATRITESLEDAGIAIDRPAPEEFLDGPGYAFEHRFLPRLWECLGDRRLLIAIDEYERLEQRVKSKKEDPDVFDYLRSLIQHRPEMAFIFFGSQQMRELTADYWHVLFNIAKHGSIGLLSETEARRLIVEPVQPGIVYDDLAVEEILRGTGRHPYFVQVVCDRLVESCNDARASYVTVQQVREALRDVVDTGRWHLGWLWNSTSPEERAVLAGLAKCLRMEELGTAEVIAQQVQQAGQVLEPDAARRALARLEEREILKRPSDQSDLYEFAASLYQTWIRRAHPLKPQMTGLVPA
jgi:hypothetical protein